MKHLFLIFFLCITIGSLVTGVYFLVRDRERTDVKFSTHDQDVPEKKHMVVRAALPYWDQENAYESFRRHVGLIDNISLFWYYLNEDGSIQKYEYADDDQSIIEFAHANGVEVSAVLTNLPEIGTWDSKRVEEVLNDEESISAHVEDIRLLLEERSFDGITVDYESVDSSQRNNFTTFIKKLSEELSEDKRYVEVALHPQYNNSTIRRYAFQDWDEIAKHADRIYIMAYEEHYDEGDPGPPASAPWVEEILEHAVSQNLPLDKLLFGIPLYGYDWDKGSDEPAEGLTYTDVSDLISQHNLTPEWHEEYKTYSFEYDNDHEVWFEEARSFQEKISLVRDYNLSGITFWRLGGEDDRVWEVVDKLKTF